MHLKRDIDIKNFLLKIKRCNDNVFYETKEGDVLNLSSALSQYVFCSIANLPDYWITGSIRCIDTTDYETLSDFLLEVQNE